MRPPLEVNDGNSAIELESKETVVPLSATNVRVISCKRLGELFPDEGGVCRYQADAAAITRIGIIMAMAVFCFMGSKKTLCTYKHIAFC
jgi:hypothetical protein